MFRKSSVFLLSVLFIVSFSMAAPLDVEIKKLFGSEVTDDGDASGGGTGQVLDQSNGLFSIGSTGDGVIEPNEGIVYDQDVTVFGDADICSVNVWVSVEGDLVGKEGVFYPECGVNEDYSVGFDAPASTGSYDASFYAGYWPSYESSPSWETEISTDSFTVEYKDSDGDGVKDNVDDCPNTAGDGSDGCPVETDSDGDGVVDSNDEFPNDPDCVTDSDGDGVCDSEDAFPDDPKRVSDSDGDGVANRYDDCINTVGPEANSGCPFDDSDGDGVKDNVDVAPNTPGSRSDGSPTFVERLVHGFGDLTGISYYSEWVNGQPLTGGA